MKLYNLTRDKYFTLKGDESKDVYQLETIDGMYSRCFKVNDNNYIGGLDTVCYHFQAWTEVEEHDRPMA